VDGHDPEEVVDSSSLGSRAALAIPARRFMRHPDNHNISVLIVHEHAVVGEGLRMLINNNRKMKVIGVARTGSEALSLAGSKLPNVILLDLDLDGEQGLSLLSQIRKVTRESRVLVLTTMQHRREYSKAVRLGVRGVILNTEGPDVLLKAIERVHYGEVWIDRSMMASLFNELTEDSAMDPEVEKIASLTERERKVIALVAQGLRNKQIAQRLFVCETTVSHRLSSIFSKLNVSDRLGLVLYAFGNGLAEIPKGKSSNNRH
jgi:two-component system nitrate/nitrite response regulator NarL